MREKPGYQRGNTVVSISQALDNLATAVRAEKIIMTQLTALTRTQQRATREMEQLVAATDMIMCMLAK